MKFEVRSLKMISNYKGETMKKLIIFALLLCFVSCQPAFGQVSTTTTEIQYAGNGSSTEFAFNFPLPGDDTSDLTVILRLVSTGVPETLTETTHYTVTATNNEFSSGGTVTTVATYSSDYTLTIRRDSPDTQEADITTDSGVLRKAVLEGAIDKNTMLIQQQQTDLNRTPKFPASDPTSSLGEIPNSIDRASKFFTFDAQGAPTATAALTTGTASFSSYGEGVVDKADAATTMAYLQGIPVFNAKNPTYGAKGDGVTNDTTALQTGLTAADGNRFHLPKGTYMIDTTLVFDDIIITGDNAVIKLIDGSNTEMMAVDGDFTRIIIDGITFDGNGANQTARKDLFDCIGFDGEELRIQNCTFKNGRDDAGVGRYLSHIENCNIDKVRILNNTYLDSVSYIGVRFNSTDGSILKDILVQGNKAEDCTKGLVVCKLTSDATFPYKRVRIIGNDADTFEDDDGIPIEIFNVKQLTIANNTLKDCHSGMTVADCDNATVTGNSIDGADGDALTSRGIELHATATTGVYGHYTVTGNTITNSTMGITLNANDITGGSCVINSNLISEPSFIGIFIKEGAQNVEINSNQIRGGLTVASGGAILFRGDATTNVSHCTIAGNRMRFTTSAIPIGIEVRWANNTDVEDNYMFIDSDVDSSSISVIRFHNNTNLRVKGNTLISDVVGALIGISVMSAGNVHNLYIEENLVQGFFNGIDTTLAVGLSSNVNVTDNTATGNTTNINTNVGHFRGEIVSYENSAVFYENKVVLN